LHPGVEKDQSCLQGHGMNADGLPHHGGDPVPLYGDLLDYGGAESRYAQTPPHKLKKAKII
jgi:hypothetical protein